MAMVSRSSSNQASEFFAKGEGYQAMDFTDIGDNEAGPFINAIINQGFIEHDEQNGYCH